MKVGIIGSGGREHAICASLRKSGKIKEIYCFPGNAGTSFIAKNIETDLTNFEELKKLIQKLEINLSIFSIKDNLINIRTFENGVGETLSCGSASLCVASYILSKKDKIIVRSIGGELKFENHRNGILMSGPTNFTYKGNINE